MAWCAHIRIDASMGTVGSSAVFWGLVYLNVLDDKRIGIESLGLRKKLAFK